jgi:hypothetical protein
MTKELHLAKTGNELRPKPFHHARRPTIHSRQKLLAIVPHVTKGAQPHSTPKASAIKDHESADDLPGLVFTSRVVLIAPAMIPIAAQKPTSTKVLDGPNPEVVETSVLDSPGELMVNNRAGFGQNIFLPDGRTLSGWVRKTLGPG